MRNFLLLLSETSIQCFSKLKSFTVLHVKFHIASSRVLKTADSIGKNKLKKETC